jgi:hypothetical protein
MKRPEKQIAKSQKSRWILLARDLWGDWTFSMWGTVPVQRTLWSHSRTGRPIGQAFSAPMQHLAQHGFQIEAADVSESC